MVSMLSTFKEKQSQNAALALTNINLNELLNNLKNNMNSYMCIHNSKSLNFKT